MTNKHYNSIDATPHEGLSAIEQRAAEDNNARLDAPRGSVSNSENTENKIIENGGVSTMGNESKAAVKRIDLGGRVSGEVLTLLGYAVQQSFYDKFAEIETKHAMLSMGGETDRVAEIVEEYMNEPFFDGAYPQEKEKKPVDIAAWADGLGRHIILNYDDKAASDITESLANLRGDCKPEHKVAIQDWLRSCGRAVREKAATKDKKWVQKMFDEFYQELVYCGLDFKIRTSIICILIGIELLREVLWEERGMILFETVGKTFSEYIDWLIESQLAVQ